MATFASLSGSLDWGETTTYDSIAHLAPGAESYTDATGGVWVCTGWRIDGDVWDSSQVDVELGGTELNAVSLWELQEPEGPDTPTEPDPITISSLVQDEDGSWAITVSGAVKGCWYWLYETDDLLDFAGDVATWTTVASLAATEEDNPQQAEEDGDIVFHAAGGETALFWRAAATSKEDGD